MDTIWRLYTEPRPWLPHCNQEAVVPWTSESLTCAASSLRSTLDFMFEVVVFPCFSGWLSKMDGNINLGPGVQSSF